MDTEYPALIAAPLSNEKILKPSKISSTADSEKAQASLTNPEPTGRLLTIENAS